MCCSRLLKASDWMESLCRAIDDPENHARLDRNWQEAKEKGFVGGHTFVIGDQIFWGHDRLDFVAEYLQERAADSLDRSDLDVLARWQRLVPNRTVPVLIDEDLVLTDSRPLLEYLAETGPELLPDSPSQRAEARCWMVYGDSVLGRSIREEVFEKRDKPENEWDQSRIRAGGSRIHGRAAAPGNSSRRGALPGRQPANSG